MTAPQWTIMAILAAAMGLFLWGRWRHDLVALAALLACVGLGVVPAAEAFSGFGHPAVITVACVLLLGHGLQITGAVDAVAQRVLPKSAGTTLTILSLIGMAALLSGFMNNVGALALLMPMAIQMADKRGLPPGRFLMPLAFGSILGGMTTLIGTPPNLIVSSFRAKAGLGTYAMFDFTPVGLAVAMAGVLFVGLIGWRLVPKRQAPNSGSFVSGKYLSEVRIVEGSRAADKKVREVGRMLDEADAQIVGMVRREVRIAAPHPHRMLRAGDILVIEVEPESLATALSSLRLKLVEDVASEPEPEIPEAVAELGEGARRDAIFSDEIHVQELVVSLNAPLVDRTARDLELRTRYSINLLAISRQGSSKVSRLRSMPIQAGDVLLVQGAAEAISGFASQYGCLPLATRDIRVPKKGQALLASLVMALAVAAAAFGLVPTAIGFAAGALAFVVLKIVPVRSIYTAIDWPVIVLLGAMLPVADAMATTGAADALTRGALGALGPGHAVAALMVVLVVTMFLSDLMNNAATAAVMCPIAISMALQLGVRPDGFLMAVAVGSSCAFLTPIGHQNNTLILGPGGFRFGDYWRLGIALEVIVLAVSVPMILWVWPL